MRAPQRLLYVAMPIWMLVGSAIRIGLQIANHYQIDPLPIISIALAIATLLWLGVKHDPADGFYVASIAWLLAGSIGRVVLQIDSHQRLDPLPAISLALGLAAIAGAFAFKVKPANSVAETERLSSLEK